MFTAEGAVKRREGKLGNVSHEPLREHPLCCVRRDGAAAVPLSHVKRRKTCSQPCRHVYREKFQISTEQLLLEVWNRPTVEIANELKVSDKAITKRCLKLGVPKPPRGYWAIIRAGDDHKKALVSLGWSHERIDSLDAKIANAETVLGRHRVSEKSA